MCVCVYGHCNNNLLFKNIKTLFTLNAVNKGKEDCESDGHHSSACHCPGRRQPCTGNSVSVTADHDGDEVNAPNTGRNAKPAPRFISRRCDVGFHVNKTLF